MSDVDLGLLGNRLGELTGESWSARGVRRASTGYANTTWLIDAEPRSLAIKVQRSPAFVYERDPSFEPAVLAALAATPVPVPGVVAVDHEGCVFDAHWFAMDFVAGRGLPDDQLAGYALDGWYVDSEPSLRASVWNGFTDALAELHSLPAAAFGPEARGGTHARMLDYWTASLRDLVDPAEVQAQERALAWLRAHAPDDADVDPRPCMGDARMANVLTRSGKVAALVDWELASVGNPRADVAYHLYLDARYATVVGRRLDGLPDADATWRRWESRTGLAATDRMYWTLFAATYMAITATRAMRLEYGFDPTEIEAANPIVADLDALLEEMAR